MAYLALLPLLSILAMTEAVVPYELTWLGLFWVPDALRKLFKLNTEAVVRIVGEHDFWVPFVTLCLSAISGSASFGYDGAAVQLFIVFVFTTTVNILLGEPVAARRIQMASATTHGILTNHVYNIYTRSTPPAADADLATRVIKSKSASAFKYITMLIAMAVFSALMTFGHFPRAKNYEYAFYFINNKGAVEVISMFTRFMSTPLLFMCKFIVKSLVYKGRTVIIKIPLIRHVMPKRELQGFLRAMTPRRRSPV